MDTMGDLKGALPLVLMPLVFAGAVLLSRRWFRPPLKDTLEVLEAPQAPEVQAKKARGRSRKKKTLEGDGDALAEDEARNSLPVLAEGSKCWHRQLGEEVTVVKVLTCLLTQQLCFDHELSGRLVTPASGLLRRPSPILRHPAERWERALHSPC